jgi:hypothetical protein
MDESITISEGDIGLEEGTGLLVVPARRLVAAASCTRGAQPHTKASKPATVARCESCLLLMLCRSAVSRVVDEARSCRVSARSSRHGGHSLREALPSRPPSRRDLSSESGSS